MLTKRQESPSESWSAGSSGNEFSVKIYHTPKLLELADSVGKRVAGDGSHLVHQGGGAGS